MASEATEQQISKQFPGGACPQTTLAQFCMLMHALGYNQDQNWKQICLAKIATVVSVLPRRSKYPVPGLQSVVLSHMYIIGLT